MTNINALNDTLNETIHVISLQNDERTPSMIILWNKK